MLRERDRETERDKTMVVSRPICYEKESKEGGEGGYDHGGAKDAPCYGEGPSCEQALLTDDGVWRHGRATLGWWVGMRIFPPIAISSARSESHVEMLQNGACDQNVCGSVSWRQDCQRIGFNRASIRITNTEINVQGCIVKMYACRSGRDDEISRRWEQGEISTRQPWRIEVHFFWESTEWNNGE